MPVAQGGDGVGEEVRGQVSIGESLLPDQPLESLERSHLAVGVGPLRESRDDLVVCRVCHADLGAH